MHELSLAEGVVEQVELAAESRQALLVERIVVAIGMLSGVEREAFEFAFPIAAENTRAESAELVVEEIPVEVECRRCHATTNPEPIHLRCMDCGSTEIDLKGGREFLIRSITLEVA